MTLAGKRALVTGASRGIGAAIAKAIAAEGADVAITYEKSTDAAAEVVRAIEAHGRRGIDILVNNAGIIRFSEVKDMALEDIDALLNVNVRAPVLASKAAIPHLDDG